MRLRSHERGDADPLIIPLVVSVVLVVGLAVFGIWSYTSYLDQKNNAEAKTEVAVQDAEAVQKEELEQKFAEREKDPRVTFLSDSSIGSIEFEYPKTWSTYLEEKTGSAKPLSATFHPKYVPSSDTSYALRLLVDESSYSSRVGGYEKDVEDGAVKVAPITVNGVTGIRVDGQIDRKYKGAIAIFPLRDKTVQIWTESEAYVKDFNAILKDNLTFEP